MMRNAVTTVATWTMAGLLGLGTAVALGVPLRPAAAPPAPQPSFTRSALAERLPVSRMESYDVNVRIRPLLLFWIGREDVGEATVTWRQNGDDHRAYEFLIGSDPERVPRRINRWGFIVEEFDGDHVDVLGIMRESGEETIEEAKAKIDGESTVSTFKAARTTISGTRAISSVITLQAPSHLTYRDVDEVIALIPSEAPDPKAIDLPPGTKKGFLVALETLLRSSVDTCQAGAGAKEVPPVRYLYNQTLFDLTLDSCEHEAEYQANDRVFTDVVDGRFKLRNLKTKNVMSFHIAYGTTGELRGIPIRMMFRPRWWMEVELELARSPAASLTSAVPFGH